VKLFLFILFISFVFWGGIHWYTKSLYTKLHNCLIKRDIEEFEKLQSKKTYKLFLSLFKVEYLKLNYAIVRKRYDISLVVSILFIKRKSERM